MDTRVKPAYDEFCPPLRINLQTATKKYTSAIPRRAAPSRIFGGRRSPSSEYPATDAFYAASATSAKPNFLIQSANAAFHPGPRVGRFCIPTSHVDGALLRE